MAKQKYEIVWKKGNLFESGRYVIQPKVDNSAFLILYYVLIVALFFVLVLTLPIWCVVIGLFLIVREKRYLAGIFSLLALLYFYVDINKGWLTTMFNYGSDGSNVFKYVFYANNVGASLGIAFIVDAILISFFGKKSDEEITLPQIIIYCFFPIISFYLIKSIDIPNISIPKIETKEKVISDHESSGSHTSNSYDYEDQSETNIEQENDLNNNYELSNIGLENHKELLNDYLMSITDGSFKAKNFFADNVLQYITLKNVTLSNIDNSFIKDNKNYKNQEFFYDIKSMVSNSSPEYKHLENVYSMDVRCKWFMVSINKFQEYDCTLIVSFNDMEKIIFLTYIDYHNKKEYAPEIPLNNSDYKEFDF